MPVIVSKFGGTSLSSGERFQEAARIIRENPKRRFIVVSAPGKRFRGDEKITDLLLECAESGDREIFAEVKRRFLYIAGQTGVSIQNELDECEANIFSGAKKAYCASRGEYLSAQILSKMTGFSFLDAKDAVFFRNGEIEEEKTKRAIKHAFQTKKKIIMPGFYGADESGNIFLFPRGGSDTSGAVAAFCIEAEAYENWTDVDGVFDKDPRYFKNARALSYLTYSQTERILKDGASVLQPDCLYWARKNQTPLRVKNSFRPHLPGTLIGS